MWNKIIEILLDKLLESTTPEKQLTNAVVRLYKAMVACHEAFNNYKKATIIEYNNWLDKRHTDYEFDARWEYWEHSFSKIDKWGNSLETLAETLYELREVFGIFDPDVYKIINEYVEQESYAYEFRKSGNIEKEDAMSVLHHFLAQHMPGSKIDDPEVVVAAQEKDASDFTIAIEELRKFIIEKLEIPPEEIFVAK